MTSHRPSRDPPPLEGAELAAMPCPADLAALARRRPGWRLPGVYVLDAAAIGEVLCGHVEQAQHAPQLHMPLLRSMLAANAGARAAERQTP